MTLPQALDAAMQHQQAGRLAEAETIYRQILQQAPNLADALNLLGVVCIQTNRDGEGIQLLSRAVAAIPQAAMYRVNLGSALRRAGLFPQAEEQYRAAIALNPKLIGAVTNLAGMLVQLGRPIDALAVYRSAIEASPRVGELHFQLGELLLKERFTDDAVAMCGQAVQMMPNSAEARNNFGVALRLQGRAQEAVEQFQAAIRLDPSIPQPFTNLGNALSDQARLDEACDAYRKGLHLPAAHSNLLYHLYCQAGNTPQEILHEHREWERRHAAHLTSAIRPHAKDRSPAGRRLRIGYLSPDLRKHSVAYFIEPILAAHDHEQFEIFCYADILQPDEFSTRMQADADHWRQTISMPDEALAEQIRADGIDILVDLAGHTSRGRMMMLARKPAPIQISYLGYPGTTGLSTIDYRITDALCDPPGGGASEFHSEKLIRLPGCFLCYRPDDEAPPVADRPQEGPIVFGSFNNLGKLSADTMKLWGQVLGQVPDSRLLLKYRSLGDAGTRDIVARMLGEHGIPRDRLDLMAHTPNVRQHLTTYAQIDIALDPLPYNGTTTTCEALWMGVPVITLAGAAHHSRVGASILTTVGFSKFVAASSEDYIRVARDLAVDGAQRASLRQSLRKQLAQSPLMQANDFTRGLEAEYQRLHSLATTE